MCWGSPLNRKLALIVTVIVLAQAVIAGRSNRLFGSWDIGLHGVLGNIAFAASAALLAAVSVAALRGGTDPRPDRQQLFAAIALVLVLSAQLGLGYAGRESLDAAAWHIPSGVLAFGLAVWNLTLATGRRVTR